jgi:hypothetical protein
MRSRFLNCEGKRNNEWGIVEDLPMRSLNKLGGLEGSPWKLRERVAEGGDTLRLHFEQSCPPSS